MEKVIKLIAYSIWRAFGGSCSERDESMPQPVFTGDMDIYQLSSILIDKFPDIPIYLPDMKYKVTTIQQLRRFLDWDDTDKQKYIAEYMDCDDFAYRLKGQVSIYPWSAIPFGIVWTDLHALNCFVDDTGKFWFVEPQNSKIQSELESWQGTELRFIAL